MCPTRRAAHGLGLGMVYQHFTLVPSLTAAENLVISREDAPRVIDWKRETAALAAFMARMPFRIPLDQPVRALAAGEKQKLEILKQLYLGRRFLILDEPTSVLTPDEADEVLGHVRGLCEAGAITVPDDHPQVPRGHGLCRRGLGPASRQAGRAAAGWPI